METELYYDQCPSCDAYGGYVKADYDEDQGPYYRCDACGDCWSVMKEGDSDGKMFSLYTDHAGGRMNELQLREIVMQAMGSASMCWVPPPSTEVFDSTRAVAVGEALLAQIAPLVAELAHLKQGHIWDLRTENDELKAELTALKGKLENAVVVYGHSTVGASVGPFTYWDDRPHKANPPTHTAKLVDIEELGKKA